MTPVPGFGPPRSAREGSLGRWSACRTCGEKAFAARAPRGGLVWVCTNSICGAQRPVGSAELPIGTGLRFAAVTEGSASRPMPSSWDLVARALNGGFS